MTDVTQGADAPDDSALFNEATATETLEKFENPVLPEPKPIETPVEKPVEKVEPKEDEAALVPAQRLREANEARRQAERERDEARTWYERQQRQPPQQQPQEPPKVDLFENPQEFVQQQFKPYFERMEAQQELQREAMSRNVAIHLHGGEKVNAAYQALEQGLNSRDPYALYTYQQARSSYDPYGVIMQWHQNAESLRTIGNDPKAYRARTEEELLSDPEHLRKAIEKSRSQALATNNNVARPVTRSSVASSPSLGNFGAGGTDETPVEPNDNDLFRAAVNAKRR